MSSIRQCVRRPKQVIEANKLAVVIEVEQGEPFDCREDVETCTEAYVDAEPAELHALGEEQLRQVDDETPADVMEILMNSSEAYVSMREKGRGWGRSLSREERDARGGSGRESNPPKPCRHDFHRI